MTTEKFVSYKIPEVPFYSQRLDKNNYKREGFTNINEAKFWSSRSCGLACVKMAIQAFTGENIPLKTLLIEGLDIDAYSEQYGWYHKGLARLVNKHGLKAVQQSVGQNIEKIGQYIKNKELVIASVTVGFEAGKSYVSKGKTMFMSRGGHLVLLHGVRLDESNSVLSFSIHHPSSWKSYEFSNLKIDRENFLNSFSISGNIIRIIKK